MLNIKHNYKKEVGTAIFISYIGYFASVVSNIVVARILGPEGKGVYSLFLETTFAIILFSSLGMGNGQIYEVSKNPASLKYFMPNAYLFSLVIGGVIGILYYSVGILYNFKLIAIMNSSLVCLGILSIPVMTMIIFQRQYFLSIHSFRIAKLNGALQLIIPLIMYGMIYMIGNFNINNVLVLFVIAQIICFVIFQIYVYKSSYIKGSFSFSFAKDSISFGLLQYLSDLSYFLVRRLDIFIVAWYLGKTALGVYSVAVSLAEITSRLTHEIGTILFPVFAAGKIQNGKASQILRVTILIMVFITIVLALLSKSIVFIIFGENYMDAVKSFQVLLIGTIAFCTIDVTWNYSSASGKPQLGIPIFIVAALADLMLNYILIPKFGIFGASISASISYWISAVLFIIYFRKKEKCSVYDMLIARPSDFK